MRRLALAVGGVLCLGLASIVFATAPASAVAASEVGYWFKAAAPGPLAPVLAPPTVPEGGIYVAQDPSGPAAVGAIRYPIAEPGGGALTLQVGGASTIQTATINVCPITSAWEPTVNGAFADAPENGCADLAINGSVSDDGLSVSFFIPITFPLNDGALEIYVVSADGSTPFSVSFEAPGEDSFEPTSSGGSSGDFPAFDSGEFGGSTGGDSGFDGGGGAATDGGSTGGGSFAGGGGTTDAGGGSFSSPSAGGSTGSFDGGGSSADGSFTAPGATDPASPAADGGFETAAGGTGSAPAGGTAAAPTLAANRGGDDGTARALAIGALVLIGAGMFFLSARGTGTPIALGAIAGGRVAAVPAAAGAAGATPPARGVGRFARPRVRPPVSL